MVRTILLFMFGYSFVFWGSTLLVGGVDPATGKLTGPWPFMYTMLHLGNGPQIMNATAGGPPPNPGAPFTAGTNDQSQQQAQTPVGGAGGTPRAQ